MAGHPRANGKECAHGSVRVFPGSPSCNDCGATVEDLLVSYGLEPAAFVGEDRDELEHILRAVPAATRAAVIAELEHAVSVFRFERRLEDPDRNAEANPSARERRAQLEAFAADVRRVQKRIGILSGASRWRAAFAEAHEEAIERQQDQFRPGRRVDRPKRRLAAATERVLRHHGLSVARTHEGVLEQTLLRVLGNASGPCSDPLRLLSAVRRRAD